MKNDEIVITIEYSTSSSLSFTFILFSLLFF